jgi:hypothetical protein
MPKVQLQRGKVKQVVQAARASTKAAIGLRADEFIIQDNQDSTCTVYGVDSAGNQADISALATLTPPPTSSDTSKITVDAPQGMTFVMHAVAATDPGAPVTISATATFNDGTTGPFTFDLPCDVNKSPTAIGGIVIVPGTPTVRAA